MPFRTTVFKTAALPILHQNGLMPIEGFEPPRKALGPKPSVSTSSTIQACFKIPEVRVELTLNHILSMMCLPIAPFGLLVIWSQRGSNSRPSTCKADALPSELQPQNSGDRIRTGDSRDISPMSYHFSTPQSTMSDSNRPYFCLEGRRHNQLGEWCILMTAVGIEPNTTTVKGQCPKPLD